MPAGFPVKFGKLVNACMLSTIRIVLSVAIEIPLFHVMSARVTFCNINGLSKLPPHVAIEDEVIVNSQKTVSEVILIIVY